MLEEDGSAAAVEKSPVEDEEGGGRRHKIVNFNKLPFCPIIIGINDRKF
jgi:hypothetical protein